MPWQSVLSKVLDKIYVPLAREAIPWAIIGSAASVLQGCPVEPRDIDLLAQEPEGVYRVAALMADYAPSTCELSKDDINWCSSEDLLVWAGLDPYGYQWHFARWVVEGLRVEMAHIVAPAGHRTSAEGGGIWEAGPEIWPHLVNVPFDNHQLPVVPLEIQIETNLSRGLDNRANEIIAIFCQRGYDRSLARKALCEIHWPEFEQLMLVNQSTN